MSQHSPEFVLPLHSHSPDILNADGDYIGTALHCAEIVRRVNLHDELVEALRNICDGTSSDERAIRDPEWIARQVHIRARAALAKVEGR